MAFGASTINAFGSAASDLFAASADASKAQYDLLEQQEYQDAAALAGQENQYTQMSTSIKEAQQNREVTQALGKTRAQVAGAGFAESGSALDIMRSNAQQGSIALSATAQQGLITEAGYQEQQQSYNLMATAAGDAASAAKTAETGAYVGAGISAFAGVATLFTGGAAAAPFTAVSDTADPTVAGTLY